MKPYIGIQNGKYVCKYFRDGTWWEGTGDTPRKAYYKMVGSMMENGYE